MEKRWRAVTKPLAIGLLLASSAPLSFLCASVGCFGNCALLLRFGVGARAEQGEAMRSLNAT